jgi:hypothetical protein
MYTGGAFRPAITGQKTCLMVLPEMFPNCSTIPHGGIVERFENFCTGAAVAQVLALARSDQAITIRYRLLQLDAQQPCFGFILTIKYPDLKAAANSNIFGEKAILPGLLA